MLVIREGDEDSLTDASVEVAGLKGLHGCVESAASSSGDTMGRDFEGYVARC